MRLPALPSVPDASAALAVLASLGAGVALGAQIRINASLGLYVGPLEASFLVHVVGAAFGAVLLARRLDAAFARTLARRPRYELLGGLLGVVMVLIANVTVPVLGTALAVSLFVASDLLFSSAADHLGWLGFRRIPLTRRRAAGLALVVLGVLLVRWG